MSTKLGDSFVNEQAANFLTRDAWQNWTPTVTQGVAVTATVNRARYVVLADTVIIQCRLDITSAGTAGNPIVVGGLPLAMAAASSVLPVGAGLVYDVSVAAYNVVVVGNTTTSVQFWGYNVAGLVGVTPNFALANGDFIGFQITYERA